MRLEKVKIKRIIGPTPSGAAILLGNDRKTFVVFVGFYEAAAIIREINNEKPARPLTHELLQNIFVGFDLEVKNVIISSIVDNTFCATLTLEQKVRDGGGEWVGKRNEVRIDARPSDCLVIALKNKVDVLVTEEVFDHVQDVSKMAQSEEGGAPVIPIGDIDFDFQGAESYEGPGDPAEEADEEPEDEEIDGTEDEEADEDAAR